jgi:hypothetical protein
LTLFHFFPLLCVDAGKTLWEILVALGIIAAAAEAAEGGEVSLLDPPVGAILPNQLAAA